MIDRDDLPETPEWTCEPRSCPLPCTICTTAAESAWMHNAGEKLGDNIVLGDE